MPKAFLFTHRRYNASPIPTEAESPLAVGCSAVGGQLTKDGMYTSSALPPSPGLGTEAQSLLIKSPGRPQAARISPIVKAGSIKPIPEEMYNLFQLAEVSLASSSSQAPLATEFRSVLERWHKQQEQLALRVLSTNGSPTSKIHRRLADVLATPTDCQQQISVDIPSTGSAASVADKPLDLSRDPTAQVRVLLTPSPSPTPSETHMTQNLGLQKNLPVPRKTETSPRNQPSASLSSPPTDDDSSDSSSLVRSSKLSSKSGDSHSSEGHECPECGKKYSTSSNLARHRQTHRSPADQKARRCPHCDKVYVSVPAFSMHVRTHSQGCKCPYCGKSFSRPWLLQGHIRTHTGEKPFCCQICDKAFADKSNLRAHIQTHSNLKPFTCQRCGKAFALKSYLYKHEESSCMKVAKTKLD